MWFFRCLALVLVFSFAGCDTGAVNAPSPEAEGPDYALRMILEDVAALGQLHDDYSDTRNIVDRMKESNPDRAAKLRSQLNQLEQLRKPDEIKAKAQEILSEL